MDTATFNHLIQQVSDKIFRLARSVLKDEEKAKDAVQELNLKLWEKNQALENVENKQAYVIRSMRNLCLDIIRKEREEYLLDENLQYDAPDPYHEIEKKDMVARISCMIDRLPELQRSVMRLRDVEEMEISEIAYIMCLTENAVSVNLSRARKSIREQIIQGKIG